VSLGPVSVVESPGPVSVVVMSPGPVSVVVSLPPSPTSASELALSGPQLDTIAAIIPRISFRTRMAAS
jgi:hypothetical protein